MLFKKLNLELGSAKNHNVHSRLAPEVWMFKRKMTSDIAAFIGRCPETGSQSVSARPHIFKLEALNWTSSENI